MTPEEYKSIFEGIVKDIVVKRRGVDKLLEWLEKTDFYTAPASAKYHGDHPGGLVEHSINVYNRLCAMYYTEYCKDRAEMDPAEEEKIAVISLFHDLCKINRYEIQTRNQKIDGKWEQVEVYGYTNRESYGHGEESVDLLRTFIPLTIEERYAIRYHMGFSEEGRINDVGKAFEKYPLAMMLHLADMQATYLDERKE